jgi:hypothetical protein
VTLKPCVDLRNIQPQTVLLLMIARGVYNDHGHDLTVTSVCDGKHGENSLHYKGLAADLRTVAAGIGAARAEVLACEMRKRLGPQYDVVVEPTHIHAEFDPE